MSETEPPSRPRKEAQDLRTSRFNRRMTHLGEVLRLYRVVHSKTVRELADELNLTVSTLNRIERTDSGMSADHFLKISAWLLASDGPSAPQPQAQS